MTEGSQYFSKEEGYPSCILFYQFYSIISIAQFTSVQILLKLSLAILFSLRIVRTSDIYLARTLVRKISLLIP
jgi:hypothetical protein